MALRKTSKPDPAPTSAVVRVKHDVAAVVVDHENGGNLLPLRPGMAYAGDSSIVKAYPWAFEPAADDSQLSDPVRSVPVSVAITAPGEAARRLDAVRAEVAALTRQLPAAQPGVDVDDLSRNLADRAHRAQALQLTIPSLERDVLLERLAAMEGRVVEADAAFARVADGAEAARDRFEAARADWDAVQHAYNAASSTLLNTQVAVNELNQALIEHDRRHFLVEDGGSL